MIDDGSHRRLGEREYKFTLNLFGQVVVQMRFWTIAPHDCREWSDWETCRAADIQSVVLFFERQRGKP